MTSIIPGILWLLKPMNLILLLHFRSLPFVFHFRLLFHCIQGTSIFSLLRETRILTKLTANWSTSNRKKSLPVDSESRDLPSDHVWVERTVSYRVGPDDLDWYGHMNNSRYLQYVDFARADWVLSIMGDPFMRKNWMAVGGVTNFFKKDLKLGAKFFVKSKLLSYGP